MFSRLHYIFRFIKESLADNNHDTKSAVIIYNAAVEYLKNLEHSGRNDIDLDDFSSYVSDILGIYSTIISYHESVSVLCLSGQALNASLLLRTQLEAYLIFYYLTSPNSNLKEVQNRVNDYRDWVMVKMHMNAKKSQDFDFFNIHPSHSDYMSATEDNFIYVKNKHVNDPKAFKSIVDSQSFLKDKAEIARQCDIEQLYKGIFSQTSATVHVADLSDRMDTYVEEETEFYTYKLGSHNESTMIGGTANILLVKALVDFSRFFQIKPSKKIDRLTKSILKHN